MKPIRKLSLAALLALAATSTASIAEVIYYYVPSTTYYYVEPPRTTVYYEPVYYTEPAIVVEAPRYANEDQRITSDVMDLIATDGRISGYVDVDTRDRTVTLNGRVTTPGQARIAAMDARSVDGVREVRNDLRTRVGGLP